MHYHADTTMKLLSTILYNTFLYYYIIYATIIRLSNM